MAGLGGLPYFIQYQGQLQQQEQAKQQQQMQLQMFQRQQQDRQRQQAAQTAAGNALPQLLQSGQVAAQPQQGQMPPPPQPPAPGQASQPMQPPQGAPLPGMGPAPGGVQPPLPPGGVPQGAGPQQPLPPFRPMPTTPPQSMAPQGAIPAPPAQAAASPANDQMEGGFSLSNIIQSGQKQGLSGTDLFDYVQTLEPYMTAQQKQKAEQFKTQIEIKKLDAEIALHAQAAQNQSLSLQERERHNHALEEAASRRGDIAQGNLSVREQSLAQRAQVALGTPEQKIDPDVSKFMAQQYLAAPDPSIFTNLGRGKQGAANVLQLRKDIMSQAKEQGLSPSDIAALAIGVGGEKAAARTAGTKAANVELAAAEAQKTFGLVRDASNQLPRTQFVPVNRALQAAQTNTGDPNVIRLGTALNTSINAYARAISPSGTPTVSDKEHARELLSTANTPEQLNAALDIMEKEMTAARAAPREVKEAQRARIAGGGKPAGGAAPAIPQGWSVQEH